MKLVNLETGDMLAAEVLEAKTFGKRLRGLMFTKALRGGTGLHIAPCRAVHTYFMKYAIDVLHLDASFTVVGMEIRLPPGKVGGAIRGTVSVVELPAGSLEHTRTQIGQKVEFQP